jgi:hypothetical protein
MAAFGLLITACAWDQAEHHVMPTPQASTGGSVQADLEDRGVAPEIENQVWLNVDQPLRIRELKGNVVLLDFWTFG